MLLGYVSCQNKLLEKTFRGKTVPDPLTSKMTSLPSCGSNSILDYEYHTRRQDKDSMPNFQFIIHAKYYAPPPRSERQSPK